MRTHFNSHGYKRLQYLFMYQLFITSLQAYKRLVYMAVHNSQIPHSVIMTSIRTDTNYPSHWARLSQNLCGLIWDTIIHVRMAHKPTSETGQPVGMQGFCSYNLPELSQNVTFTLFNRSADTALPIKSPNRWTESMAR